MSKNKKHSFSSGTSQNAEVSHAAEYRIIKIDLLKVFILNLVYLVGLLALYYANKQNGFLERMISNRFHF